MPRKYRTGSNRLHVSLRWHPLQGLSPFLAVACSWKGWLGFFKDTMHNPTAAPSVLAGSLSERLRCKSMWNRELPSVYQHLKAVKLLESCLYCWNGLRGETHFLEAIFPSARVVESFKHITTHANSPARWHTWQTWAWRNPNERQPEAARKSPVKGYVHTLPLPFTEQKRQEAFGLLPFYRKGRTMIIFTTKRLVNEWLWDGNTGEALTWGRQEAVVYAVLQESTRWVWAVPLDKAVFPHRVPLLGWK